MKRNKPICKYCNGEIELLRDSNHIIGCKLEAFANVLIYRGLEEEAIKLEGIASRLK